MAVTEAERVLDADNVLGESPIWSAGEGALYWVDILAPALHRLVPATGERRSWPMPSQPGSIGFRAAGGLVAALRDGFCAIDVETGAVTRLADPEADRPEHRFNDGRCDRAGRFWAGSMHDDHATASGALYRLDPDHAAHRMIEGLVVPNSLCWSPDGRTMYHGDSAAGTIFAYDFDAAAGSIAGRRVFAGPDVAPGAPDGAVTDAEGCVWSARWGAGRVVRLDPDGRVERTIRVPARQVTCCAFGGPGLTTLYITTARENYGERDLRDDPLAGSLFAVDVGIRGAPEPMFRG